MLTRRLVARIFDLFGRPNTSSDDISERSRALANARNEPLSEVVRKYSRAELRRCPKHFSPNLDRVKALGLLESGIDEGLAYVKLENGKTFYGLPSAPNVMRQYAYVHDLLPSSLKPETLRLALDVAVRYNRGSNSDAFAFPIKEGDTVLEVGAFQGLLALWFAEQVGPAGKVIAIEMMPENISIMRKNVDANRLSKVTEIVEAGVWDTKGKRLARTKGLQRSSLSVIHSVEGGEELALPVDTLDNILVGLGVDRVDVAFITVNGSEVRALKGFENMVLQTDKIAIASPYSEDGKSNADECREFLASKGFEIIYDDNPNLVLARNARRA